MKVIEDFETDEVIIDDIRIAGFISDDKCSICDNYLIYYEKYDAFFCAYCNEWTGFKCSDNNCEFCKDRPERPFDRYFNL